ncbi:MAG: hypothetical protein E2P02_03695 [Acidobacteria bacterium]|nr:MAG: hypothetical protein E2P02_03695 [Acidobacteriota bacterium]
MLRVFRLIVLSLLLCAGSQARDEAPTPTIATIEIYVEDVFEDNGRTSDVWPYRAANRLHIKTRESIIRQELLFAVGDSLDMEAVAQTERNLRALPFLRRAEIESIPLADGRVLLRVTTSDAWSTLPEFRVAKVGNEWVWAAGASETNLFGLGKQLRLLYDSGLDRDKTFVFYRDPRTFGSRVTSRVLLSSASDGHRVNLSATRPFFSIGTLWSFHAAFEDFDRLDPLFQDGERIAQLRHYSRRGEFHAARALKRNPTNAVRLHLAYVSSEDDIAEGENVRRFGLLQVGVSSVVHRFLKLTHIHQFERIEDFNLGNVASAFFGISTPALGGEDLTSYSFFLGERRGLKLPGVGFVLGDISWRARYRNDRIENGILHARANVVQKLSLRKLILAKADFLYGTELDPEVQFRLGAESGLRGYPVRQFNGNRSLLISLEGRWFLTDNIGQLVSVGIAGFFDSGFAWPRGQPMRLSDMHSDIGLSLLLGANRVSASTPGIRIDFAYALDPIDGRSRWLLSAGSRIGF